MFLAASGTVVAKVSPRLVAALSDYPGAIVLDLSIDGLGAVEEGYLETGGATTVVPLFVLVFLPLVFAEAAFFFFFFAASRFLNLL